MFGNVHARDPDLKGFFMNLKKNLPGISNLNSQDKFENSDLTSSNEIVFPPSISSTPLLSSLINPSFVIKAGIKGCRSVIKSNGSLCSARERRRNSRTASEIFKPISSNNREASSLSPTGTLTLIKLSELASNITTPFLCDRIVHLNEEKVQTSKGKNMNSKNWEKIVFTFAFCCLVKTAAASGIPTVDAAAIAQMVQQLTQLQQMYSQMQAQYNTAVNQLNNFTGTRMLGTIHYDTNLRNLIPLDARQRLNSVMRGGSLSDLGKQIFDRLGLGEACEHYEGEVRQECLKSQNFKAEQQAILEEGQTRVSERLENIESLMGQINSATDVKAIADLQARIQVEQVALESSKLAAEFQQAQFSKQAEEVEKQAKQKAMKEMFPELTLADIKAALQPVKH